MQRQLYDSEEDGEDPASSVTAGRRRDGRMVKLEDCRRERDSKLTAAVEDTQRVEQKLSGVSEKDDKTPTLLVTKPLSDSLPGKLIKRKNDDIGSEREETEEDHQLLLEPAECSVPAPLSHSATHSNTPGAAGEPPKKRRRGRPRKRRPSEDEEDRANNTSIPPSPATSEILLRRRSRRPRYRDHDSDSGEDGEQGFILSEYQWPVGEGVEWCMLQEHVAEFLDIRGMQRRYPGEGGKVSV